MQGLVPQHGSSSVLFKMVKRGQAWVSVTAALAGTMCIWSGVTGSQDLNDRTEEEARLQVVLSLPVGCLHGRFHVVHLAFFLSESRVLYPYHISDHLCF